jgi:hypothetical protein
MQDYYFTVVLTYNQLCVQKEVLQERLRKTQEVGKKANLKKALAGTEKGLERIRFTITQFA